MDPGGDDRGYLPVVDDGFFGELLGLELELEPEPEPDIAPEPDEPEVAPEPELVPEGDDEEEELLSAREPLSGPRLQPVTTTTDKAATRAVISFMKSSF